MQLHPATTCTRTHFNRPPNLEETQQLLMKMKSATKTQLSAQAGVPTATKQQSELYILYCLTTTACLHIASTVTVRNKRYGQCPSCRTPDCGHCTHCKDMRKFGGPGCKKKGCMQRKCTAKLIGEVHRYVRACNRL